MSRDTRRETHTRTPLRVCVRVSCYDSMTVKYISWCENNNI